MTPDLFSPIQLGACRLKSRIFMAPLTRSRAGEGNAPRALNALYYAQRADAGLIITEATQISATAQGYVSTPGIHTSKQVEGWKRVVDAVHIVEIPENADREQRHQHRSSCERIGKQCYCHTSPARRWPMMPEPTTAASSSAVPTASAAMRRAGVTRSNLARSMRRRALWHGQRR